MTRRTGLWLASLTALVLVSARPVLAADPAKAPPPAPTAEQRQKMAEVHQKMADCLRSDRPIAECRSEMATACHDMMGAGGCPMMGTGPGGMGPGMKGHGMGPGMMQPPDAPKK